MILLKDPLLVGRRRHTSNWLDRATEDALTPLQRVVGPHSGYEDAPTP